MHIKKTNGLVQLFSSKNENCFTISTNPLIPSDSPLMSNPAFEAIMEFVAPATIPPAIAFVGLTGARGD